MPFPSPDKSTYRDHAGDDDSDSASNAADLSLRFLIQLDQEHFGGVVGEWHTLFSAQTLPEALRYCSECISVIQNAIGLSNSLELPALSQSLRVWDSKEEKIVAWEDKEGRLWAEQTLLEPGKPSADAPPSNSGLDPGAASPNG